jgi:hypothetical protein
MGGRATAGWLTRPCPASLDASAWTISLSIQAPGAIVTVLKFNGTLLAWSLPV